MNCARFETLLTDYMDGTLDVRVLEAMEEHQAGCPSCSRLIADVRQLRDDLEHLPELPVREELIRTILERTSGIPEKKSFWRDLVLPNLQPFLSQRYAFATLMMFVFISFAVNVMGPGFSVSSYSRFSPTRLVERADLVSEQVYQKWSEFNDLKMRISEEIRLFKEDLFGRLDYHLITVLFESYDESLKKAEEADSLPGDPLSEDGSETEKEDSGNE